MARIFPNDEKKGRRRAASWVALAAAAGLALMAAGVPTGCGSDPDRAAREQLRIGFVEAHRRQSVEALLGLYALEGVEPQDLRLMRAALAEEITLPVAALRFVPLAPGDGIHYEVAGRRFGPTVAPILRLEVTYAVPDRLTASYLVGRDGQEWKLVAARPVEEEERRPEVGGGGGPQEAGKFPSPG